MMSLKMRYRFACTYLLFTTATMAAGAADLPALDVYGETYPNACGVAQQRMLKSDLDKLTGDHDPVGAWQLVRAVLCGNGLASERLVLAHMPAKIAVEDYSTGDDAPTRSLENKSADIMLRTGAWNASVNGTNSDFSLDFTPDSVSVESLDMHFNGHGWLIVARRGASD